MIPHLASIKTLDRVVLYWSLLMFPATLGKPYLLEVAKDRSRIQYFVHLLPIISTNWALTNYIQCLTLPTQ